METEDLLNKDHFGNSVFFRIAEFNLTKNILSLTEKIPNPHRDHGEKSAGHGEEAKAGGIASLLPGVQILAGHAMGTNAAKMKQKYHILLFKNLDFSAVRNSIQANPGKIREFVHQEEKKILRLEEP